MRVKRTFIATFEVEAEERDFPIPEELATSLSSALRNEPDDPYLWGDGVSVYEDAESLLRDIMDGENDVHAVAVMDVDDVAILPFAFSSHDDGVSKLVPVYGLVTVADHGLTISVRGYSDMMDGDPILLHHEDGRLELVVWANRKQEDPTVTISLEGARE